MIFPVISEVCQELSRNFDSISAERKALLAKLASYIQARVNAQEPVRLIYVCTHNSRRSHFGQVWAAVAAAYYQIPQVTTFSGGTEATAFNPNAIRALQTLGFTITDDGASSNPTYTVAFGEEAFTTCFSKVYNHAINPTEGFAAIMTCSDAEQNCPFIPGVDLRIGTTYNDPKAFDHTPLQDQKYLERAKQIGTECLYVFSLINR